MGSAKGNRPLLANEIRLISPTDDREGAASLDLQSSAPTSIEKLVERLQFQNPHGAVAYLQANPRILGQMRLMNHLEEKLQ